MIFDYCLHALVLCFINFDFSVRIHDASPFEKVEISETNYLIPYVTFISGESKVLKLV
jgi:hypothetical protein